MALASQPLALQILIELGAPGFCAWRITFGHTRVEGYSRAHIRSDQVRRDALSSGRAAQAALFDDAQDTAKQVARRGITSRSFRLQRSASINQCRGTPPMRLMRIWCTAECAAIVSARLWRADGSKKNRVHARECLGAHWDWGRGLGLLSVLARSRTWIPLARGSIRKRVRTPIR